jgi:hypothetical protein
MHSQTPLTGQSATSGNLTTQSEGMPGAHLNVRYPVSSQPRTKRAEDLINDPEALEMWRRNIARLRQGQTE